MDVERELARGIALHNDGCLGDAARCYRTVLLHDPGNIDALNLMSALATQAGQAQLAADLARQAIAGDPGYFAPHLSLGNAMQALGDTAGAIEAFRQAVALNPDSAEGFCNLASALNACDRFEEANDAAVRALTLKADFPAALNNFGNALLGLGSPGEAVECYQKSVVLDPDSVEAWHNLGNAQMIAGDPEGALAAFAHALQLDPSAVRLFNLGNAFLALAQFEEAARCFAEAIDADGGFMDAWMNLSVALKSLGRLAEAEAVQRDTVALAPDDAEAHFNLAVLLLQQGKYAEGWSEYEWRWGRAEFLPLVRKFPQPRWGGERFGGKTLLVTAEQGFGDAIEFARFVPAVAARGGRVVVECRPGLERLLSTVHGCAQVVTLGDELPLFDLYLPMMSLPGVLGVTVETVPAGIPYLSVPAGCADFGDLAEVKEFKVGIVWAGKATREDNQMRSCRLDDFTPLLEMAGVRAFSLQVGGGGVPAGSAVHDLSPRLGDFADTAAAVAQLDMVVTVDTSVAHVAGALGKPVWVLLSRPSNGFLWMDERDDSPWYPTARLFRQPEPGDWGGLMDQVCSVLREILV